MIVITAFLLCVIGVKCAAPMAHMARTARTIAGTVLTGSAMLSQENACVTLAFMAPSRSRCLMLMWMFCVVNSTLGWPKAFLYFCFLVTWALNRHVFVLSLLSTLAAIGPVSLASMEWTATRPARAMIKFAIPCLVHAIFVRKHLFIPMQPQDLCLFSSKQ